MAKLCIQPAATGEYVRSIRALGYDIFLLRREAADNVVELGAAAKYSRLGHGQIFGR